MIKTEMEKVMIIVYPGYLMSKHLKENLTFADTP